MEKVSWNHNQKQIDKIYSTIWDINHFYAEFDTLSDEEIKAKTDEFKQRLQNWETLDDILPEAFATVKQAAKRLCGQEFEVKWEKQTWNMIHYDVQLIWGIVLHQGKIAEMKTWEGKTLVATCPVYLNALEWKWVHVVTVNDYLSSRDAEWMWVLYEWLGLTVWSVTKGTDMENRKDEYQKDITYVENSELGFDYLRDNLVRSKHQRSLLSRSLNFAIVDEIDSILVDEARTPLIISQTKEEPTEKYEYYAKIVQSLAPCSGKRQISKWLLQELLKEKTWEKTDTEDGDYYIDEKTKTVSLSWEWISKLEQMLGIENLYKDIGYEEIHHIENALRAKAVYIKDKEYIVKEWEVMIVDENTGRTMPGRRFSEWLHQAIEAKETVEIKKESKTIATITYQNFFKQYNKLGGMTGTATTEAEEFAEIYDLEVLEIPTNKPLIRADQSDKVYFNQKAKWNAIQEEIAFYHEIWQPILIGTSNIQTSELVSRILEKAWLQHYVLNAKFHEQESKIVWNSGKYKSLVVATNMAGRWTDIKLDKDLNTKLANNYATWIKKNISNNNIEYNLFSETEFEYTVDGLQEIFGISNDEILKAEKSTLRLSDDINISIKFNKAKKVQTDKYATISFNHTDPSITNPTISKDIHYWLFVLGTEKHESRRIDNQLRGRAGRQWDAGRSVFFVALDDLIMRKIGWEKIQAMAGLLMNKEMLETMELTQKQFSTAIIRAQKQMEAWHFGIRKHLFDYDSVINKQRMRIYTKRDLILETEDSDESKHEFKKTALKDLEDNIEYLMNIKILESKTLNIGKAEVLTSIIKQLNIQLDQDTITKLEELDLYDAKKELINVIKKTTFAKMGELSDSKLYMILKDIYLHFLDKLRIDHIDEMSFLKDKVGFAGYAQQDPLLMYKSESFDKFQNLIANYKTDTTTQLLSIDYQRIIDQEAPKNIIINTQEDSSQFVDKLKNVTKDMKIEPSKIINDKKTKTFFQDEDWIEVFESDDEDTNSQTAQVQDLNTEKKLRPNDKVNVKYENGKVEYEVKYKKVKDDIDSGKAKIF